MMSFDRFVFLILGSFSVVVHASEPIGKMDQAVQTESVHLWVEERKIEDKYLLKVPTTENQNQKEKCDEDVTLLAVRVIYWLNKLGIDRGRFGVALTKVQAQINLASQMQEKRLLQRKSEEGLPDYQSSLLSKGHKASPRPLRRNSYSPVDSDSGISAASSPSPTQFSTIDEQSEGEEEKKYRGTDL